MPRTSPWIRQLGGRKCWTTSLSRMSPELRRGIVGVSKRHGTDEGEPVRRLRAPLREGIIQNAAPGTAGLSVETIAVDIGPGGEELPVEPLLLKAPAPRLCRLHELGEEGPDLEAVIERQHRK